MLQYNRCGQCCMISVIVCTPVMAASRVVLQYLLTMELCCGSVNLQAPCRLTG